jgi:hypothetical protein
MPRAAISKDELNTLLRAIVEPGGKADVENVLDTEHQYHSSSDPMDSTLTPYEKYFRKLYSYQDFELHIRYFTTEGYSVTGCDLQFKRSSQFPAPFLNRNRKLIRELAKLLRALYYDNCIEVKDKEHGGGQLHFNVSSSSFCWTASTSFEDWQSECALYDEPYSSGSTDPKDTDIRNDFIIIRFRKDKPPLS